MSENRVRARGGWGTHIENDAAYAAAVQARIKANATKGRADRWHAADATRAALVQELTERAHAPRGSAFLAKMWEALQEWGSLTEGQEAAVRKVLTQDAAKRAEFRARDAASVHVGTMGERLTLTLRVSFVTSFEGTYGTTHVTGLRDDVGNVFICKGVALRYDAKDGAHTFTRGVAKGDRVTLKATVKDHGEREGVKQTRLARPKVLACETAPAREVTP